MKRQNQVASTELKEAETKLRALMDVLGIDLGPGELRLVSPAQAALLDFFRKHPFATVRDLEIQNGDPIIGKHVLDAAVVEKCRFLPGNSTEERL